MAGSITIGAYDFWATDGGLGPPIKIGEPSRSFSGTRRSSERAIKRTFNFTLPPITESEYDNLQSTVSCGAHVTCSGALLSNTTLIAAIEITAKLEVATSPIRFIVQGQGEEV